MNNLLQSHRLKRKYRKVLDNLSAIDKIKTTLNKTKNIELIEDIFTYYELFDYPHKILAFENFERKPKLLCLYALKIIKGRWPEAERAIKTNAREAFYYARFVIKGRWPEAENVIVKDSYFSFAYAEEVIKGRWPEAEKILLEKARCGYTFIIFYYANHVINERFTEAEHILKKDEYYWNEYKTLFGIDG
jgi:hypothetical protein